MSNLLQVNEQWSTRPSDQRFTSLTDLHAFTTNAREHSSGRVIPSRALKLAPVSETNARELVCLGPNGVPVAFTNWSFGQTARLAGAPAGYLADLPAPLVADCVNYGLQTRDVENVGVLLYKNGGPAELRAVTGPTYGRVWNSTITAALCQRFGDGLSGQFRIPGEFGIPVPVTKENTTLYASDRDLFVFLCDEHNHVEINNRRNTVAGAVRGVLSRGFMVWNSEVGDCKLGIATFLYDFICRNRIIWGATEYAEVTIRHTSRAPERWLDEVTPALESYANSSTHGITEAIAKAQAARIPDVDKFLLERFTRSQTAAIKAAHMDDEQRPIETLWDATTAVTAYARGITYQDERTKLERVGGKILQLAQ